MSTKRHTERLIRTLVLTLVFAGAPTLALASAADATTTTCAAPIARWGSLTKSLGSMSPAPITNVRAGRHACFDRLVVDTRGNGAGYTVSYVPQVLSQGRGTVIPLRGGARLDVVITAPTYNIDTGTSTYNPANARELVNVAGFSTFRQIASGGSFEGFTTIGLGVRARLPMRAFILAGPGGGSRLVVDVAHHW